ncbi:hypothetical protein Fmac_018092 [Flemingia macrophylla]|uniref:Uncharacterized protein n=1 Tax=Flemingia macrophylla TaxID=520843 RepID=A0ABD1M459_9FABA
MHKALGVHLFSFSTTQNQQDEVCFPPISIQSLSVTVPLHLPSSFAPLIQNGIATIIPASAPCISKTTSSKPPMMSSSDVSRQLNQTMCVAVSPLDVHSTNTNASSCSMSPLIFVPQPTPAIRCLHLWNLRASSLMTQGVFIAARRHHRGPTNKPRLM